MIDHVFLCLGYIFCLCFNDFFFILENFRQYGVFCFPFYGIVVLKYMCGFFFNIVFRGVAYYVILPRQGVWGPPEALSGVQGQSPVGRFGGDEAPISDFEQFRVYLGQVLLQNSHTNIFAYISYRSRCLGCLNVSYAFGVSN